MMIELFAGQVEVHYGQFYLELDGTFDGDMAASFAGQENGLSGAQAPAVLFLITGLHTGPVGLTINLFESEPETDVGWEEIVEVSIGVPHGEVTLMEWAADQGIPMAMPGGDYRARYSGQAMQHGNDINTNIEATPIDHYRLDLWPAKPSPDKIINQTSPIAAYWHDWARNLALADK